MKITKSSSGRSIVIREHWYELLWIQLADVRRTISLGEEAPKFFLPVGQERFSGRVNYWILPIAPFAMILSLLNHMFKSFWFDLVELLAILHEWVEQKRK